MITESKINRMLTFLIGNLSSCKYLYRNIIEGCYQTAIDYSHYDEPDEGMDFVVDKFLHIMSHMEFKDDTYGEFE